MEVDGDLSDCLDTIEVQRDALIVAKSGERLDVLDDASFIVSENDRDDTGITGQVANHQSPCGINGQLMVSPSVTDQRQTDFLHRRMFAGRSDDCSRRALSEPAQGEIIRRVAKWFENYDALLCPAITCPPFDVKLRYPTHVDGVELEGYMGYLVLTCAITVTACPVVSLPGGFTKAGLPVGLQLVGPPRSEARLLSMAAWVEKCLDVRPRTPIDPRDPRKA